MRAPGYDKRLYLLAFDHRSSFTRDLFGVQGQPSAAEAARVSAAKGVIYAGFQRALARGAPREACGILVDEQFGADIARQAQASGVVLAMPVEASGRKDFAFEYGADFGAHIESFDPTFNKVLVRYNPDDPSGNAEQTARLRELSDWLRAHDRRFLFELLVPATDAQLASVNGDAGRYDAELRPTLETRAIAELQAAGIEPDIWKIEGLDERADAERVAAQARAGGRDHVVCVVLGRAAPDERLDHWLRVGAPVPGFDGFAIGRTIWQAALEAWRDGQLDEAAAAERIAERYLHAIEVYEGAA
jgi:myo-inositol catabolism protein IolC